MLNEIINLLYIYIYIYIYIFLHELQNKIIFSLDFFIYPLFVK